MSHEGGLKPGSEQGGVVAGEIRVQNGDVGGVSAGKVSLSHTNAAGITAASVRMMQSAARSVRGEEVSATLSAALQVDADHAEMRYSSVGLLEADQATVGPGVVYAAVGQEVDLKSCYAKTVLSQGSLRVTESIVGAAAAREIEATDVRAGILIAREVKGSVRALMDTRAAAVFGAAFGAAFAAVWLLRRR